MGRAGEEIHQRLRRDLDQPAEPEHRGRPLAVVDELVRRRSGELESVSSIGEDWKGVDHLLGYCMQRADDGSVGVDIVGCERCVVLVLDLVAVSP